MRSLSVAVACAALAVAGCGAGYKVEFQNDNSITYWYDPARQSMGSVQGLAQEHCARTGRDALPQASTGDRFSGISMSFVCRPRP
ncbi:hypothetical protein [uncultured Reyranella sp.]|uniref:hypothetical protein n=1 Tax=uncultured Reyranella sp. TaxID=735512 RepID=UPI00259CE991|nr:hypothetical protein [uncultured Reyranella sp.]